LLGIAGQGKLRAGLRGFDAPSVTAASFIAAVFAAAIGGAPRDGRVVLGVAEVAVVAEAVLAKIVFVKIVLAKVRFRKIALKEIMARRIVAVRIVGAAIWLRNVWRGLAGLGAEIWRDGLGLNLALAQGGEIIGYGFFFVEADLAGVGADETLIEDAAGKLVKVFFFDGAEHAGADFGGVGDSVEGDATLLALFAKFFSERTHGGLRRAGSSFRPHRDG
jgi:hypothetical protein